MPWFLAALGSAGSAIGSAAGAAGGALGSAAGAVGSGLGSAAGAAGGALGSAGSAIGSGLSSAGSAIGSGLGQAAGAAKGALLGTEGGGAMAGGAVGPAAPTGGLFGSGGSFSLAAPGSKFLAQQAMGRVGQSRGGSALMQLAPNFYNTGVGRSLASSLWGSDGTDEGTSSFAGANVLGGTRGPAQRPVIGSAEMDPIEKGAVSGRGRIGGLLGQGSGMFG